MGYSTTYRWGGYSEKDAQGLINHDVREPGVVQSNKGVDPSRTHLNELRIWDPETGDERAVKDGEDPAATVRRRLDAVLAASTPDTVRQQKMAPVVNEDGEVVRHKNGRPKMKGTGEYVEKPKARRKDATVMLEIVLQLDGDFTNTGYLFDEKNKPVWEMDEEGNPKRDEKGYRVQARRTCADMSEEEREEARRLLEVMIQETWDQFPTGQKLYAAIHWDEMHPHAQVALVPTLEDGRVNATELLAGKASTKAATQQAYQAKHDGMRARLLEEGYDATFERVDGPKRHVGLQAYKEGQEAYRREQSVLADAADAVAARELALEQQAQAQEQVRRAQEAEAERLEQQAQEQAERAKIQRHNRAWIQRAKADVDAGREEVAAGRQEVAAGRAAIKDERGLMERERAALRREKEEASKTMAGVLELDVATKEKLEAANGYLQTLQGFRPTKAQKQQFDGSLAKLKAARAHKAAVQQQAADGAWKMPRPYTGAPAAPAKDEDPQPGG